MMSADESYELGLPLQVGDVLATTFRTLGANPAGYLGLAALVTIPNAVIGLVLQVVQYEMVEGGFYQEAADPLGALASAGLFGLASIVIGILSFMASIWVQGAMVRIAVERVRGRSLGARDALMTTLRRYPAMLGAGFLFVMATGVGSLLCLVPGLLAYLWLVVALPAAACEEIGPFDALGRSIDLTEGSRLTIFLVALVIGSAFFALSFCLLSPMFYSLLSSELDPTTLQNPLSPMQLVTAASGVVVQLGWIAVTSVLHAVIYAKLRGLRDEVDAHSVAEVFA